jgi:hypothetical protein
VNRRKHGRSATCAHPRGELAGAPDRRVLDESRELALARGGKRPDSVTATYQGPDLHRLLGRRRKG